MNKKEEIVRKFQSTLDDIRQKREEKKYEEEERELGNTTEHLIRELKLKMKRGRQPNSQKNQLGIIKSETKDVREIKESPKSNKDFPLLLLSKSSPIKKVERESESEGSINEEDLRECPTFTLSKRENKESISPICESPSKDLMSPANTSPVRITLPQPPPIPTPSSFLKGEEGAFSQVSHIPDPIYIPHIEKEEIKGVSRFEERLRGRAERIRGKVDNILVYKCKCTPEVSASREVREGSDNNRFGGSRDEAFDVPIPIPYTSGQLGKREWNLRPQPPVEHTEYSPVKPPCHRRTLSSSLAYNTVGESQQQSFLHPMDQRRTPPTKVNNGENPPPPQEIAEFACLEGSRYKHRPLNYQGVLAKAKLNALHMNEENCFERQLGSMEYPGVFDSHRSSTISRASSEYKWGDTILPHPQPLTLGNNLDCDLNRIFNRVCQRILKSKPKVLPETPEPYEVFIEKLADIKLRKISGSGERDQAKRRKIRGVQMLSLLERSIWRENVLPAWVLLTRGGYYTQGQGHSDSQSESEGSINISNTELDVKPSPVNNRYNNNVNQICQILETVFHRLQLTNSFNTLFTHSKNNQYLDSISSIYTIFNKLQADNTLYFGLYLFACMREISIKSSPPKKAHISKYNRSQTDVNLEGSGKPGPVEASLLKQQLLKRGSISGGSKGGGYTTSKQPPKRATSTNLGLKKATSKKGFNAKQFINPKI